MVFIKIAALMGNNGIQPRAQAGSAACAPQLSRKDEEMQPSPPLIVSTRDIMIFMAEHGSTFSLTPPIFNPASPVSSDVTVLLHTLTKLTVTDAK